MTAAFAAVAPSLASDGESSPTAHAAKKKKKKPLTAIVNGTFIVRYDDPLGFGNDAGANWQELRVMIKDAKFTFDARNHQSAAADVKVRFEYVAEAHTMDRSWAAGCDREDRVAAGGWDDKTSVVLRETNWLQTNGKSKKYGGWQVLATPPPQGIYTVTRGSYQEWESILMENCLTVDINEPLGGWSTGFARPDGLGRLATDGRSVPLTAINTDIDQTGKVQGSIKFNKPVTR